MLGMLSGAAGLLGESGLFGGGGVAAQPDYVTSDAQTDTRVTTTLETGDWDTSGRNYIYVIAAVVVLALILQR